MIFNRDSMKAQKIMGIIILISLMTSLTGILAGAQSANSALSLANLRITPQPLVAGGNATIVFQLYNSYTDTLSNVNLQVTSTNPLINLTTPTTTFISAIGQGLYGGGVGFSSYYYTIHIPSQLAAGEYTINVTANYQTEQPGTNEGSTIPGESVIPIHLYVYGIPNIGLNANPTTAIVPGAYEQIPITVLNGGTDKAYNLTISILSTNSFTVVGPSLFDLGGLPSGASTSITPALQANSSIQTGTYYIDAIENYTTAYGASVSKNVQIPLKVVINTPDIVASIVSGMPTNLYSGGNQTLTIELQNTGLGTAKNVSARFIGGPGINIGSISQFFIASLGPKNSTTETLYISANRSFASSNFSIPVSLKYQGSNYEGNYAQLQYLPINLQKSAVFNITSVSGTLTAGVADTPLTFRVKNVGNEPAEQVSLSLQTTFPITPVTPTAYITTLAPNQTANVTFSVGVDPSGTAGSYPVTLYEQWRQPNGAVSQEFSGSEGYYSSVTATKSGISTADMAIIVIVIIAVIAMIVRRRMKRSKKQAKKE